jgi:tetratricopeptide (TPR) repeat protein
MLGSANFRLGKGNAISFLDDAIKVNPNFGDAYYIRGKTYYDMQEDEKAIEDLEKAIRINLKSIWLSLI